MQLGAKIEKWELFDDIAASLMHPCHSEGQGNWLAGDISLFAALIMFM